MLKSMLVCLAVICAGAVAYAAETAAPAPTGSATVAPAASTESALAPMGPQPAPAAPVTVDGMSGVDILKKVADTYVSAKSYYEESRISATADVSGQHQEQNIRATVALKRPDLLRIDIDSTPKIAIWFNGGEVTVLNRDKNKFLKRARQEMASITRDMQFPLTVIALSDSPSDRMKEEITSVNSAKAADLDGKAVYEVDCTGQNGKLISYFVDKARFVIVTVKEEMQITGAQGAGKVTISQTADKVLVNETPKDTEGKEMDVFKLTLPETATEVPQPGPPAPSTGSNLQPAPAASTGSNLQPAPAAK